MDKNFITYYSSPPGLLCIRGNEDYITSVAFVNSKGEPEKSSPLLVRCVSQLEEYFHGSRKKFDLPLKQSGTVFQLQVWQLLQQIEFGKTVSYLQFSQMLGDAKAIRAVAAANGKNAIAIIVPCHRVIGSDGSLTGYAGGLERKKWLLQHEGSFQQELF